MFNRWMNRVNTIMSNFMARSNVSRIDAEMRSDYHGVYQVEIVDSKTDEHISYVSLNA